MSTEGTSQTANIDFTPVSEIELNNTLADATYLSLTEDPAGSGLLLGYGLGNQDSATMDDPDYWRIELQAGDRVSVSIDTPDSDVDTYVELSNAADGVLAGSYDEGPGTDSFISRYGVTASGSYYVLVSKDYYSNASGSYQLHVNVARGIDQESDANYSNDSIAGANVLSMSAQGAYQHATVAGTVMGSEGRFDKDVFALGRLNAGNTVELGTRLTSTSSLSPLVTLLRADGTVVADEDGNAADGHFMATLSTDSQYYAQVTGGLVFGGHQYLMTDRAMSWTAAEAYAQSLGGHLVTIDDAAEQQWVEQNFSWAWVWTGFTDQAEENQWMWSSGAVSGYTNWAPEHPYSDNTYYSYAYMQPDGEWYTGGDSWNFWGVIEIEGAAPGVKGSGPEAKYLLDVNVLDQAPPRVESVGLPSESSTVYAPVEPSFTVTLSERLDAATVAASTGWDLREAGTDGVFDTADDVIHRLVLDGTYSLDMQVKFLIEDGSLSAGHYRFTANAMLHDVVGNALDGNGDGIGGDAYHRYFTIEMPDGVVFEGWRNNTALNATVLPLTEEPAGSGLLLGHGVGNQDPAVMYSLWSDPDYWRVELQAGDWVSVSIDTPESDVDTYVELRNADDGTLAYGYDEGPGTDAFISSYVVTVSGSYYVVAGKDYNSPASGSYQLHVDVARGIDLESDANYSNDSIDVANVLSMSAQGAYQHATVAGTVMGREERFDKDVFALGMLSAGNEVELGTRLTSMGTLSPLVTLLRADGTVVADEDGNAADGHFKATLSTDGQYYAQIESVWNYGGHQYLMTDATMSWTAAESYAQSLGGHLVTIDDAAEQQWVAQNFSWAWIWTGLTDQAEENRWLWLSGAVSGYTNWAPDHPYSDNTEYSYAYMKNDGKWYTGGASWGFCGLIEIEGVAPVMKGPGPEAKYLLDVNVSDQVPPRVESVGLPSESSTVYAPVASITVTLSETPGAATVAASNGWDLREAGTDGVFDTDDDVIHRLVLDGAYSPGTQVKLLIEDGSLGAGHYRFTANAILQDVVGNALDGNGDGIGGDAYHRYFTIEVPDGVVFEGGRNNTALNATVLPLAEEPAGSGLLLGHGLGNQDPVVMYSYWSDPDYWRVELQAGDWVSVSVDTPDSDVNTYVELRNADDVTLEYGYDEGPWMDAFISRYGVTSSGSYYVVVGKDYYSTVSGSYQLHIDVARGIDQESDANYSNDSISGANVLSLSAQGTHQIATVAGTVMGPEERFDKDVFALGKLNAGNMVELGTRLTSTSTLSPLVTLLRADGTAVADEDGNAADGHFMATLSTDGQYYAQIESVWTYGGHNYRMTDRAMSWTAAEAYAQSLGGHLVTIDDAAEQQWVAQIFSWARVWTGFTDQAKENNWMWSSGAASGYTNWATGHPYSDNTYYSYAYMTPDGKWYTVGDNWSFCGLIEIEGAAPGVKGSGPEAKYLLDAAVWPTAEQQFADLEVTTVVVSESVAIGQPFSVQWRVANASSAWGATQVSDWYDRVVVSSDDVIGNGDDIVLGSFAHHGSLEKGSSYLASAMVTIPQAVSGPLKLFVTTDSTNSVYEFNYELNNSSALIPLNTLNQLTGAVTFWKTDDPITGVTSTLTSVPDATGTQPVEFRNMQVAADGSRTIEIWETSPKSDIGSVDLEFSLSAGSVATWQDGAGLPTGWIFMGNTDKPGHFILGGYGATALSVGPVRLGTLSLTAPTDVQHFDLSLSNSQLGNEKVPGFGITSDSMTTGADGLYRHINMPDGPYTLTAEKVAGTAETPALVPDTTWGAVDLLDAITILKSIVGLTPLNHYQEIAADFNKSGGVDLNDAIGILKHVVGLPAPTPEWVFVDKFDTIPSLEPMTIDLTADTTVDLVGILHGDVNGSWVA
ncbi:MAG: lectin-like protein [Chlorobium sp.]